MFDMKYLAHLPFVLDKAIFLMYFAEICFVYQKKIVFSNFNTNIALTLNYSHGSRFVI